MAKRDLSSSSQHVFSKAYALAEQFDHSSLDTDHLLFGLLTVENTLASRTLRELGMRERDLQQTMERKELFGFRNPVERIELSPDVEASLLIAVSRLTREGRDIVEPGDLLFGLMRLGQSAALDLLRKKGITNLDVLAKLTSLRHKQRSSK